jgi:hypothetical protein
MSEAPGFRLQKKSQRAVGEIPGRYAGMRLAAIPVFELETTAIGMPRLMKDAI